jgi:AMMECR1 domain-containing protein
MDDPPISRDEQEKLLWWVRATIEAAVRGERPEEIPEAEVTEGLRGPHGVFVTLKKQGGLRGCIGKMDFERPLWANAMQGSCFRVGRSPILARYTSGARRDHD